ncbi:MAG: Hsp20/alpha crystallin family protein [Gammaproteobacteria bacterium]
MSKKDKEIVSTTQSGSPVKSNLISFDELDRWFDDFFSRRGAWPRIFESRFPFSEREFPFGGGVPKVDIIDHDDEVEIHAALPGVKKEDLDVSITENLITIRAEAKHDEKTEDKNYYRREISRDAFQRTLTLPAYVNGDKAKASFKDGMLNITLPKTEPSKRKSIEIK